MLTNSRIGYQCQLHRPNKEVLAFNTKSIFYDGGEKIGCKTVRLDTES